MRDNGMHHIIETAYAPFIRVKKVSNRRQIIPVIRTEQDCNICFLTHGSPINAAAEMLKAVKDPGLELNAGIFQDFVNGCAKGKRQGYGIVFIYVGKLRNFSLSQTGIDPEIEVDEPGVIEVISFEVKACLEAIIVIVPDIGPPAEHIIF